MSTRISAICLATYEIHLQYIPALAFGCIHYIDGFNLLADGILQTLELLPPNLIDVQVSYLSLLKTIPP